MREQPLSEKVRVLPEQVSLWAESVHAVMTEAHRIADGQPFDLERLVRLNQAVERARQRCERASHSLHASSKPAVNR